MRLFFDETSALRHFRREIKFRFSLTNLFATVCCCFFYFKTTQYLMKEQQVWKSSKWIAINCLFSVLEGLKDCEQKMGEQGAFMESLDLLLFPSVCFAGCIVHCSVAAVFRHLPCNLKFVTAQAVIFLSFCLVLCQWCQIHFFRVFSPQSVLLGLQFVTHLYWHFVKLWLTCPKVVHGGSHYCHTVLVCCFYWTSPITWIHSKLEFEWKQLGALSTNYTSLHNFHFHQWIEQANWVNSFDSMDIFFPM